MARWEGRGRFRNGRPSSNVRVADETHSSGRRFELRCLTDAANAQAQSRAAPSLKRHYWIMPRFDQQRQSANTGVVLRAVIPSAEQRSEPISSARIAVCIGWSDKFFWLQNWFCRCK